jgi:hypothetical protein
MLKLNCYSHEYAFCSEAASAMKCVSLVWIKISAGKDSRRRISQVPYFNYAIMTRQS